MSTNSTPSNPGHPSRISEWLRRLRNKSLSFLKLLSFWISKLTAPFKKLPHPITIEDDSEKESTGSQEQSTILSQVMPSPPYCDYPQTCRYRGTPRWKTLLEVIAVGTVIWYTIEAHRANEIATNAMQQNQRPWVGPIVEAPIVTDPVVIDQNGFMTTNYRMSAQNFGNYGANNVQFWAELYVAQDITSIWEKEHVACSNTIGNSQSGRILFPGKTTVMLNSFPAMVMNKIKNPNANPPTNEFQVFAHMHWV
jgi:hypothetical protein